jgi:aminoglycoside phosphotransferase family enzyme
MTSADKFRFLNQPGSYPHRTGSVAVRETHTAWVFLTDDRAYKLKKPVVFPFLDFRSLDARAHFCREEVRLNRALAGDVYIGTVPLVAKGDGSLALGGKGRVVDWLVEMRRLPEEQLLDSRLGSRPPDRAEIAALAKKLSGFYAARVGQTGSGRTYLDHLIREDAKNADHLKTMRRRLDDGLDTLLETATARLHNNSGEIEDRISAGFIVEGHGDLRPEHVCMITPPVIIDCLEFDPEMRLIDPYDEINYLGLECDMLGAPWIRSILLDALTRAIGHRPSDKLLASYSVFRALLRARLSIDHLLDEHPRTPEKWPRQANAYLKIARSLLDKNTDA